MVWVNYSHDNNNISGMTYNLKNQLEIQIAWFDQKRQRDS